MGTCRRFDNEAKQRRNVLGEWVQRERGLRGRGKEMSAATEQYDRAWHIRTAQCRVWWKWCRVRSAFACEFASYCHPKPVSN